jgi:site-specific DNA recombinase
VSLACQNLVVAPLALPVVVYAAKSTADEHGSIPTQLADGRALAESEGLEVVAEYQDQSASAYSGNRGPGLERAMEHAARLAPCALIVQHSDRLARGDHKTAKHLLWYALWALERDVELRSVQDPQTFGDLLYTAVTGQRNHEDSKRKSAAVRSGKRRRFERGDSTGPLQFGYRLVKVIGEDNRVVTTRVLEPDEAAVVMEMYRLLDRGLGIGDITRWVNGQGVRTKRGNPFGRDRVRDILTAPWYGGKVSSKASFATATMRR